MKIYNKLVRDKIPEIILRTGQKCFCRELPEEEYEKELNAKLREEVAEYLKSGETEELADIEEVIRAILERKGVKHRDFEKMRRKKEKERGTFKKRIFLINVD